MKHSVIGVFLSSSFLMIILFATGIEAQATIRRVPTDYSTIQQAINASVNGDTVLVGPGTYLENINFLGKAITVRSEAGPQATIIDGNHGNSVVTMHSGEGATSVLSGFALRNGNASASGANFEGGGIDIQSSSPTITGNIISNNVACNGGGGIGIGFGSPLIQGNTITGNFQSGCSGGIGGGGISVRGFSSAQIIGNIISNNSWSSGGGISLAGSGPAVIRNNVISNNHASEGGGISMFNFSPAEIVQNLITGNTAGQGGGIFWSNGPASVVNNTIADNDSQQSSGIHAGTGTPQTNLFNNIIVGKPNQTAVFCDGSSPGFAPTFQFTNAFSPQGTSFGGSCAGQTGTNGNISADPLFANQSANDYHLLPNSPSVDSGNNAAPNLPAADFDGNPRIQDGNGDGAVAIDMGVYESVPPAPPFDICIQDDSGGILRINSTTGDYQFTNCSGFTLGGTGGLIKRGGIITLQHYASDRRVLARIDTSVSKGTASIQLFSPSTTFTITDRNTTNNTCACPGH